MRPAGASIRRAKSPGRGVLNVLSKNKIETVAAKRRRFLAREDAVQETNLSLLAVLSIDHDYHDVVLLSDVTSLAFPVARTIVTHARHP